MKLIVGLGNPGKEYNNTRHNIGFMCIDHYISYKNITEKWSKKFDGEYLLTSINGEKVLFLKPLTFMNLSGNSVRKIVDYYNIEIDDILIISDDLDLNTGNYKLKSKGSCGGHNGLRDIENKLNTNEYKRIKIGISNNKESDTKDYVLGKISVAEKNIINTLFDEIDKVIDDFFKYDFFELMNKYNRKNK